MQLHGIVTMPRPLCGELGGLVHTSPLYHVFNSLTIVSRSLDGCKVCRNSMIIATVTQNLNYNGYGFDSRGTIYHRYIR